MEYFIEQAANYTECLNKIRLKYGDRVTILNQRSIRMGGFWGLFAKDGVEISGFTQNNYAKDVRIVSPSVSSQSIPQALESKKNMDFETERKKLVEMGTAGKKENPTWLKAMSDMADDVKLIKERLDKGGAAAERDEHPSLARLQEAMELNDFSSSFTQNIIERCKKEISFEGLSDYDAVQDKALEWIGESIRLYYKEEKFYKRPRIMVLVGPTGVGKTTTIAKLAAIFKIGSGNASPISFCMITIDAYRIGAKAQMEVYGDIMQVPVSYVEDYNDLKQAIAQYSSDMDMILVDTIGKSPRKSIELGEMKQLLDACGPSAEVHLALAATTKCSDIKEILRQFEPFNYQSVIITKLDETIRMGNVISALAEKGKLVSYITDGQKVPGDIQRASVVRFLINLEGFHVKRSKFEKLFPINESEQVQWRK
ncbi:MAG: flagellar biosynthesis protein FlhF [Treponema sp.]|jgi:flagellar biosynthesis protein FlhF|nr:flagellar biosynthesis protein FlhF [Treponema sp.]